MLFREIRYTLGAAILSIITYAIHRAQGANEPLNLYCAVILIFVVVTMSFVSVWQERKANQVTQGFKKLLPSKTVVIRDCEEREIDTEELVVGDLVFLKSGSHIPADLRILQTNGLSIESSSIRGW